MEKEEALFQQITEKLAEEHKNVTPGKMMSAPSIKYKNKVFAFYAKKEMVFRLGKNFQPGELKIESYRLLNPFKNKPPLAGWFQISYTEHRKWEKLARRALAYLIQELAKELKLRWRGSLGQVSRNHDAIGLDLLLLQAR